MLCLYTLTYVCFIRTHCWDSSLDISTSTDSKYVHMNETWNIARRQQYQQFQAIRTLYPKLSNKVSPFYTLPPIYGTHVCTKLCRNMAELSYVDGMMRTSKGHNHFKITINITYVSCYSSKLVFFFKDNFLLMNLFSNDSCYACVVDKLISIAMFIHKPVCSPVYCTYQMSVFAQTFVNLNNMFWVKKRQQHINI